MGVVSVTREVGLTVCRGTVSAGGDGAPEPRAAGDGGPVPGGAAELRRRRGCRRGRPLPRGSERPPSCQVCKPTGYISNSCLSGALGVSEPNSGDVADLLVASGVKLQQNCGWAIYPPAPQMLWPTASTARATSRRQLCTLQLATGSFLRCCNAAGVRRKNVSRFLCFMHVLQSGNTV